MPIFSETLNDEQLINLLTPETKRIYIVGCGACENESLAYTHDMPITKDVEAGRGTPYATTKELERLTFLLGTRGISVESKVFDTIFEFVCMLNKDNNPYDVTPTEEPDLVLALCCDAGYNALKELLPKMNVIKITKQTGIIFYSYSDKTGDRIIDKKQSCIIPIKQKTSLR